MSSEKEIKRIVEVFNERYNNDKKRYSMFNLGEWYMEMSYELGIINAFKRNGISSLENMIILEIGCGNGVRLRNLQRLGAIPSLQYGIDLLDLHIKEANTLSSNCNIIKGNAESLPYGDKTFDMVYQRTVFTSIKDRTMRKRVASEMLRVLKDDGIILWYDMFIRNPHNKNVEPIARNEVKELFYGCSVDIRSITLAPPISRRLAPVSLAACFLLEKIGILRTHLIGIIKK